MDLREKIEAIFAENHVETAEGWRPVIDAILAIPEIVEALGRSYKGIPIVEDETLKRGQFTMTPPSHRISTAD